MKFVCPKCDAINPELSYRCHRCRFDLDSHVSHSVSDRSSNPALSAPFTQEDPYKKFYNQVEVLKGVKQLRHIIKYYLKNGVVKNDALKLADELIEKL